LQEKYKVPVRVIGNGDLKIDGVRLDVRQWSAQTEVSDLQDCSVGMVPLVEHPSNKWKFFLKVIQYLAVGLPVVAQKAGSNSDVIKDGVNGFVVENEKQWYERLALLIEDDDLRRRMSRAARQTVLDNYTPQIQMPRVAQIFEEVLAQGKIEERVEKLRV
jgi:glycosyltransferase involved in cell wall biosynthesis